MKTKLPINELAIRWINIIGYFEYDEPVLWDAYAVINSNFEKIKRMKPYTSAILALSKVCKARKISFNYDHAEAIVKAKQVHKKLRAGVNMAKVKAKEGVFNGN